MAEKKRKRAKGEGTKRKDGRWMIRATINGETIPFYGKSQKEVKEKIEEAKEQAKKGIFVKNNKVTFGEWLDLWLKEYTGDIKPGIYDFYEYLIRIHVKPDLGHLPLNSITIELLDKFYNKKKMQKKQRAKNENDTLSKKIVGDIRKVIGMGLKKAVIKRKITFNPNDFTESIGKSVSEIEYLTPNEIVEFLDKVSDDYWYPAFVTALGTGLRVGELAGLQRNDFDLEKGFVKVNRNVVRVKSHNSEGPKTKLLIQTPKTKNSVRKVPLPVDVINDTYPDTYEIWERKIQRDIKAYEMTLSNGTNP
jgi:integrase